MASDAPNDLIHFHAPNSRSRGVLWMLQELGVDHHREVLNFKAGDHKSAAYLATNPMGKVPAIKHKGVVITELPAICMYLADAFADKGLAPAINDPNRGPYLRWIVYYGSCLEPAMVDKALKREPGDPSMMPYGDIQTAEKVIGDAVRGDGFILGEQFSAADVVVGSGVSWLMAFGLLPSTDPFAAYASRIKERPAFKKAGEIDDALAAQQASAG